MLFQSYTSLYYLREVKAYLNFHYSGMYPEITFAQTIGYTPGQVIKIQVKHSKKLTTCNFILRLSFFFFFKK